MPDPFPSEAVALTDTRLIDFGPASIRVAAETVGVAVLGLPLWSPVGAVQMQPADDAVRLEYGCGDNVNWQIVAGGELAALLISYCIAAKVPLPNKAVKKLHVTDRIVSLEFVIISEVPPRPTRLPMHPCGQAAARLRR